jgi:hypothetical protein
MLQYSVSILTSKLVLERPFSVLTEDSRMVNASPQSASLAELLSDRARSSSDSRLVAEAIGGLSLVLVFHFWRVAGWYLLVAIGACFLGYGAWAIANRELLGLGAASRARTLALRTVSVIAAACGIGGALFLIMVLLARTLGRVIS